VQGSAADLMKIAMILIDNYLEENNLRDDVQLLLTMHDELVFRIKKHRVDIIPKIEEVMRLESTLAKINWKVPLEVDVEIGPSWDIHYEYPDMLEYVREVHGGDGVAFIYGVGQNYKEHLEACSKYHSDKKETKKEEAEYIKNNPIDKSIVLKEDFKKGALASVSSVPKESVPAVNTNTLSIDESSLVDAEAVDSLEEATASAADLDKYFQIVGSASLSDLPEEAHYKLKKYFYEKEVDRIMSGSASKEDLDIELPIIVHDPIDTSKKNLIGYIIDSCPGMGRVKFLTEKKEELHNKWVRVDVLKAAMMSKIFNL